MAGRPLIDIEAKLNTVQMDAFKEIRLYQDRVREAKLVAEEKIRSEVYRAIAEQEAIRDLAIREAYQKYLNDKEKGLHLNRAKARGLTTGDIKKAMRTSDHRTVMEIINGMTATEFDIVKEWGPQFEVDIPNLTARIFWAGTDEDTRVEGPLFAELYRDGGGKWQLNWNVVENKDNPINLFVMDSQEEDAALIEALNTFIKEGK